MRDDLHHSLPQSSLWRAAVKAAGASDWGGKLPDAIARAVWASGAAWWNTGWGHDVRELLSARQRDFFDQERLERSLDVLERISPDHMAQRFCEIARAAVMIGEPDVDLCRHVIHATLEAHAVDCFEHAGARIEAEHPKQHAREVRQRMLAALPNCNLAEPPPPKKRERRKSVEDGLRTPLHLSF